jgi:hypothetical protein
MATLGKPSITTPNALDLRVLQTAVSNIRQRIEAIEGSLGVTVAATTSTSSVSLANILSKLALLQSEIDAIDTNLTSQIEGLPVSSGAAPAGDVPMVISGVGVRVSGGDIARLLFQAGVQSGADPSALVPVEIGGVVVLVTAGDIAALGGGGANLEALIDALPYSSGAEPSGMVPFTVGGVALRATAADIARLIFHASYSSGAEPSGMVPFTVGGVALRATAADIARLIFHASYSSGADKTMLVPVQTSDGAVVLVSAGDIAALGGGGGSGAYYQQPISDGNIATPSVVFAGGDLVFIKVATTAT